MALLRTHLVHVCGRWDSELTVLRIEVAGETGAQSVSARVISHPRVVGGTAADTDPVCALPVSVTSVPELGRLFVANHAGATPLSRLNALPHGHRGALAVLDAARVLDPAFDGTDGALLATIDLAMGGPVASALTTCGHLLVTSAEGEGSEDGGYRIAVLEARTGRLLHHYEMAHRGSPSPRPSPDRAFGGYPNPNGIALAARAGLVFTANGGSDDVSVLRLPAVLANEPGAEIGRVPLSSGGFGIAISPDERLLAVAERESAATGEESSFISLIDVEAAARDPATACRARIVVGTDDAKSPSRPSGVAFSADGRFLYVTCNRTGVLSRLDVAAALKGTRDETRLPLPAGEGAASPRGIGLTADGQLLVVAGGARKGPRSGRCWVINTVGFSVVATADGVGNEPYFLNIS